MNHRDFLAAGFRAFGLHRIADGKCTCGRDDCHAAGKHPVAASWQHTPDWSDEQIETMEALDHFATGYGVLVAGLLVVDVDARNGGMASYERLLNAIPEIAGAGLVVTTGSGGGSKHLYFRAPPGVAMLQHLPQFSGIDFKSSGYVVGPGSLHASGGRYEAVIGTPCDITDAPPALVDLLLKPDKHRAIVDGTAVDVSACDIDSMLAAIDPDTDHETWYRCGMAIHQITGGTGFDLWDAWSARGTKYPGRDTLKTRWHSFGKSTNPVTIGTLRHYAQSAGWIEPVTFHDQTEWAAEPVRATLDSTGIDLLRPPGFVGEVAKWINSQSIFPRENLAVAAALMVISNVAGMRYTDPLDCAAFNLFCFGVADSATGKEAILQAHNELLRAAGVAGALVGGIKSEQEIYRNLIRHQAAFYAVDEMGEHLAKITSARTRGGAVYLEGVIGTMMSLYSKANSFAPVNGDLKEEIRKTLIAERSRLQKAIDEQGTADTDFARRLARLDQQLATIDMGLEAPFLSIFGLTTPERFDALMDFDMAANGFIGRALIFREHDRNPKIRPRGQRGKTSVPDAIRYTLASLYAPGYAGDLDRVERVGDRCPIQTTPEAVQLLDEVSDAFWAMAEEHRESTGLHPIPRRGYELVTKISGTLAIPSGLRTAEHVRWAYTLARRDIEAKMRLAHANSTSDRADALYSRILATLTAEHGDTARTVARACRAYSREDVDRALATLVSAGQIIELQPEPGRGNRARRYARAPDSAGA